MPHQGPVQERLPTRQLFGPHCDLPGIIAATQHAIDDLLYEVHDYISSDLRGHIRGESNRYDRTARYFQELDNVQSAEWTRATWDWFGRNAALKGKLSGEAVGLLIQV